MSSAFFNALWGNWDAEQADDGRLAVSTIPAGGGGLRTRFFVPDTAGLVEAAEYASNAQHGADVYFGLGLVKASVEGRQGAGRGTKDDVVALPGFWLDLDVAGPGHAAGALPPSSGSALDALQVFGVQPSAVVHTGGGLHTYETGPNYHDLGAIL